jgi:hypothetical protein
VLLAQGRLPEVVAERFYEHVGGCSECANLLNTLQADDPFFAELRIATAQPPLADPLIDALVGRLVQAPPGKTLSTVRKSPDETTAMGAGTTPSLPGYEILEQLGRGGMGVVYLARHLGLGRLVAVKMLGAGAGAGPEEVQCFLREAEAVARLRHANIVQVYDVGGQDRQPFFTMEFVEGGSLAQKLAGIPQAARPAAALVEQLARAVEVAHQNGIIHRDLKPANVLLTADGTPKITDFGLAKRLEGDSGLTRSGAILGTPSYMAPEQARGQARAIGSAADIYALGATLYEMLTGRPPFRAETAVDTVLQVIAEEPVPPARLNPRVPRDLETICLKCLHKEPSRRFASAAALAEDLRRFGAGEPILARPVGRLQRLGKWARRRPAVAVLSGSLLAAALALIATLVAGILMTGEALGQAQQARDLETAQRVQAEKDRDDKEKARQEAVDAAEQERLAKELALRRQEQFKHSNTILTAVFQNLNPRLEARGGPSLGVQLGEQLDRAAQLLEKEAFDDALAAARLQMPLGQAQLNLGHPKEAIALFTRARRTFATKLGFDHAETLTSMNDLGMAYQADGQRKRALDLLEETLKKRRGLLGPDHPETLTSMNNLALAFQADGQLAAAIALHEQTLKKRQERLGLDHLQTLTSMNNLAMAYQANGQMKQALPLYEDALARKKTTLGIDHPDTLTGMNNLATTYHALRRLDRALPLYEEALQKRRLKLGANHPDTLVTLGNLAGAYMAKGQSARALELYEEALEKWQANLGADHPDTLVSMSNLASAYQRAGKLDRAIALHEQALAKRRARLGPSHLQTLTSMNNLAAAYYANGQLDRAAPLFEQTLAVRLEKLGDDHPDTLAAMINLATTYQGLGRLDKALPLFEQTWEKNKARFGADHPSTLLSMNVLAMAYYQLGRHAEAEPLLAGWIAAKRPQLAANDLTLAFGLHALGECRVVQKKFTAAEMPLRESQAIYQTHPAQAVLYHVTENLLGAALAGQKKYAAAEPLLVQSAQALKAAAPKLSPADRRSLLAAVQRVIDLYEVWERPEDAARWRMELATLKKT